ncbi:MAG TPA: inositol 2-dehydrogenase [Egibacteraceae bacterium]|nr:inositol 2-dehydrogenase [Egibacteraceae bacterium]
MTDRSAPLGIALLGAGRIGALHARLIDQRVEGAAVAAVYDPIRSVAEKVADGLGGAPVAATAEQAIDAPGVEAVAICSSAGSHVPLIIASARAGKAIFCEKPLSLDLAEIDRALAAVAEAGVPLQVGFNRRFDPAHRSVREAVLSGAIGTPHLVRITSRDPAPPPLEYLKSSGGIFLDQMIHDFDMARYVVGSEVARVFATGAVRIDPAIGDLGDFDTAGVVLEHADETLTLIDNSRQAVYGYDQRVEVLGSEGVAASDNPLNHTGIVRTADGARAPTLPYFFIERYIPSYIAEWEAFVAAVQAETEPPVTGADGRAPLVIGQAALRSVSEHRPVDIAEIDP